MIETWQILTNMVYTEDMWRLLFTLKPILTL